MESAPYFIGLALFFAVVSIGLLHRFRWMWYLGWVILYLLAAKAGEGFFTGLREARNGEQVAWACVYLAGGLVLWIPTAVWWAVSRRRFGLAGKSKSHR